MADRRLFPALPQSPFRRPAAQGTPAALPAPIVRCMSRLRWTALRRGGRVARGAQASPRARESGKLHGPGGLGSVAMDGGSRTDGAIRKNGGQERCGLRNERGERMSFFEARTSGKSAIKSGGMSHLRVEGDRQRDQSPFSQLYSTKFFHKYLEFLCKQLFTVFISCLQRILSMNWLRVSHIGLCYCSVWRNLIQEVESTRCTRGQ
jgi:hypothetical protein